MTGDRLYPYLLEPKESPAIWGGDALVKTYGKRNPHAQPLGESWECWDENEVMNGAYAGRTVAELRDDLGDALTGPADPSRLFPVLTKIIDAHAALSVQVHPDDAYAQRVEHQQNGKTECWYVLACEPGAELVLGWTHDETRADYERRVADGSLGDVLRRVPVKPGDAFYLPAGSLHAIGAGIQIFETQQASDLTYRIFDWNRTGADGKPRELHVAKAGDVLDYRATFPVATTQLAFDDGGLHRTLLIADTRFLVERIDVRTGDAHKPTHGRAVTITAMDAHLRVDAGDGTAMLNPWQTCIVPAAAPTIQFVPGGTPTSALMVTIAPDLAAERRHLTAGGVSPSTIESFFAQFKSV